MIILPDATNKALGVMQFCVSLFTRPLAGRAGFKLFRLSFLTLPTVRVLSRPAAVLVIEPDSVRRTCGAAPSMDGDDWLFPSLSSPPPAITI